MSAPTRAAQHIRRTPHARRPAAHWRGEVPSYTTCTSCRVGRPPAHSSGKPAREAGLARWTQARLDIQTRGRDVHARVVHPFNPFGGNAHVVRKDLAGAHPERIQFTGHRVELDLVDCPGFAISG